MNNKDNKGKIFLIPSFLSEDNTPEIMAPVVKEVLQNLTYFLVEEVRTARRFISKMKTGRVIDQLKFFVLDKDTNEEQLKTILLEIPDNEDIGIISEAGCPGVADPGAVGVMLAHKQGRKVIPLPGPSSILMALMSSGFQGQKFTFHGYLPIEKAERIKQIKFLEKEANSGKTEIFMETPYRNNLVIEDLLKELNSHTLLCIACNITASDEEIKTTTIANWKNSKPDLHKKPTIFLLGSWKK